MADNNKDMISSLQAKFKSHTVKEEENLSDDNWNDYSEEEEDYEQQLNVKPNTEKIVVQSEVKAKTYSKLKDMFQDDQQNHNKKHRDRQHHHTQHQNQQSHKHNSDYKPKTGYTKPSFHNSGRNEMGSGIEIKNTNTEYGPKYDYRPKHNAANDKDNLMKSISNFGTLIKNTSEENSKIKPPTRDYTEVDFNDNYKKQYRNKQQNRDEMQKPKFMNRNENRENYEDVQKPKFVGKKERREETREELQRPQFVNKNLENKESNFVELNKTGDLYLKKLQTQEVTSENLETSKNENVVNTKANYINKNEEVDNLSYNTNNNSSRQYKPKFNKFQQQYQVNAYHTHEQALWKHVTETTPTENTQSEVKPKKIITKKDSITITVPKNIKGLKDMFD